MNLLTSSEKEIGVGLLIFKGCSLVTAMENKWRIPLTPQEHQVIGTFDDLTKDKINELYRMAKEAKFEGILIYNDGRVGPIHNELF